MLRTVAAGLLVAAAACGGTTADRGGADSTRAPAVAGAPVESTTADAAGATGASPASSRAGAPRALFIGTSLTYGLGLDDPSTESWPAVIQQIADSLDVPLHVVNAGLSGETSAGALRRTDWLLREPYDLVVIETGANDGLRGLNPDTTAENIRQIVAKVRAALPKATLVIAAMEAPTNMGPRYTAQFRSVFPTVARETGSVLLPFILEGVGGVPRLNQPDGIHPTAEGARMVARNAWPGIRMALRRQ